MTGKINYIDEILARKKRLLGRKSRIDQFERRVHPLVRGFRSLKTLNPKHVSFRDEWLKYGAIGYVACIEGCFRLLFADLINHGPPFSENITGFKDIKVGVEAVVAIHSEKVTLGEFISHLLPVNNVSDINGNMSIVLGIDFLKHLKKQPVSKYNPKPFEDVFPDSIGMVERLFQIRHLYCHELATRERVSVREIENCIGDAASFVLRTEEIVSQDFLGEKQRTHQKHRT